MAEATEQRGMGGGGWWWLTDVCVSASHYVYSFIRTHVCTWGYAYKGMRAYVLRYIIGYISVFVCVCVKERERAATTVVYLSLFFGGWGEKGGQTYVGGGGGRGRHRNDFFPITLIVHNHKSNGGGGGNGGGPWCEWGTTGQQHYIRLKKKKLFRVLFYFLIAFVFLHIFIWLSPAPTERNKTIPNKNNKVTDIFT